MPITAATIFGQVAARLPAKSMTPAFRRQLFGRALRAQITSGVGLPTSQALLNTARKYGVGFRESQMRGIIRAVRRHGVVLADQLAADPAKALDFIKIPDATIRLPDNFRTYFRADVLDIQTGKTRRELLAFDSDVALSPNEAERQLRSAVARGGKFGTTKRIRGVMTFSGMVKRNPDLDDPGSLPF